METFHEKMMEYKTQLSKGFIQIAYKGLMDYIHTLRTYFKNKYPDYFVSGSIYYGFMDMTYFAFTPKSLQDRGLKVAIVFVHETFRFEVWLAGVNKQVQAEYWNLFKQSGSTPYPLVPATKGVDAILKHILVEDPDFRDLDKLTGQIESEILIFIKEIERFISDLP